jgi:hypothetical protein
MFPGWLSSEAASKYLASAEVTTMLSICNIYHEPRTESRNMRKIEC